MWSFYLRDVEIEEVTVEDSLDTAGHYGDDVIETLEWVLYNNRCKVDVVNK